jgi:hypothetical protein
MGNPALHYPGDGGCSYQNCPNRSTTRVKRGNFLPLGEIRMFSAGTGIHVECMNHILRHNGGVLDDMVETSDTTRIVSKENDNE